MNRVILWTLALALGCAPTFTLRGPPTLPMSAPRAPTPPSPAQVEPPPTGTRADVTSAHSPPDLRAQTVAVVVEGADPLRAAALTRLPTLMVRARMTRVMYPSLQAIETVLERGGSGDRVTFRGTLPQLAMLQARTPAGHLLRLELRGGDGPEVVQSTYEIPAEALAAYRHAHDVYRAEVARWRAQVEALATPYRQDLAAARLEYESRGGRYQSQEEQARLSEAQTFDATASTLVTSAEAAAQGVPTPEQLAERASHTQGARSERQRVVLRATLTDLTAGETYWIDDIDAVAATLDDALRDALARALTDLAGAPPATTP